MSNTVITPRERHAAILSLRDRPPFNARPVCAAGRASRSTEGPYATHYTATASYLYINRIAGTDRFGKVPDGYLERGDLMAHGRYHPGQKMPKSMMIGDAIWREADDAAAMEGERAVSATHIVASLPLEADLDRWVWLVRQFAYCNLVDKGMIADWAIHGKRNEDGSWAPLPHVHILVTARHWRPTERQGMRNGLWLGSLEQTRNAEDAWLELLGLRPSLAA
jgi:hypothetical protein